MAERGSDPTGDAIAWRAIRYGTPVTGPDGGRDRRGPRGAGF